MRISTNILSLSAQRTLAQTSKALARAMERLASGSRVNTARDDAAALGIGSGLEAQRRGMLQAVRNMNDARGFLDTADGALSVQSDLIQRMRELAMQAANGTYSNTDRGYLETEFQQLLSEFNRITSQTNFNGVNLLDGTFATRALQVGAEKGQSIEFSFASMQANQVFLGQTAVETTAGGAGTFQARTALGSGLQNSRAIAAVDVNGDGKMDLLRGNSTGGGKIHVLLGNGDGSFEAPTILSSNGNYPSAIITSDLNGDGKADILSFENNNTNTEVEVWLGNGNGTFRAKSTSFVGGEPSGMGTADFNGDGKQDLATANYTEGAMSILLGNGDGSFQTRTTVAAGAFPSGYTVDVNGDGKADLLCSNMFAGTVSIGLGNGNGTFGSLLTLAVDSQPSGIALSDMNGDGRQDLAVGSFQKGAVSILLGNGNGTFQTRNTVFTGPNTCSVVMSDLNGDSKRDLIATSIDDNTISIAFGNGNGTFQTRVTYATGSAPVIVRIADFNNDTALDLVTGDGGATSNGLYFGNLADPTISYVMGPAEIHLTTQSQAQDALAVLDGGLTYVNTARASIGAVQSRLDFAQGNALNLVENLSAARSQLMDADYAQEVADFTRLQILQQAGISVLSQANMSSKLALDLLRGV